METAEPTAKKGSSSRRKSVAPRHVVDEVVEDGTDSSPLSTQPDSEETKTNGSVVVNGEKSEDENADALESSHDWKTEAESDGLNDLPEGIKQSLMAISSESESNDDEMEGLEELISPVKKEVVVSLNSLAKDFLADELKSNISSDSDSLSENEGKLSAKIANKKKEKVESDNDVVTIKSESEKDGQEKDDKDSDEDENDEENESDISDGTERNRTGGSHKLLKCKISESDSDFEPSKRSKTDSKAKEPKDGGKRKRGRRQKGVLDSDDSDFVTSLEEAESEVDSGASTDSQSRRKTRSSKKGADDKKKGKKRRRIKEPKDSSNEGSSDDDSDNKTTSDGTPSGKGRKNIRRVIKDSRLHEETKAAAREEEERRQRVGERQKMYNEVIMGESQDGWPVAAKLVLDRNLETEEDLVEVHEKLITKLKPHQVEGVKFLWETVCESIDRMKKHPGSGCILAHCMGLGKTLQVITFVHTVLSNPLTNLTTCLVVCPLNTVLNWENEFQMWLEDDDLSLTVFELTKIKNNSQRAAVLRNWHETGGIMIMGYDMFRNLVQEKGKRGNKRQKESFLKSLIDPGPDIVVCDEGHILKNDATALAKAMNRIKTLRRVVLTGTPLQNNLSEYHCMVHFVKPNLLGTRKEFQNRFMNPIVNGQCADSTASDFRLMKRRAHILHNLLDGCVQRRDYNVLTPFLPPKHEYVISIRLSEIQIKLYRYFLDNFARGRMSGGGKQGSGLFADYQGLMKIWTHPHILKLAEIRDENKMVFDSEDSFIDDESMESTPSESESDIIALDQPSSSSARRTRGSSKRDSPENSDDEVINNWQTKRRAAGDPEEETPVNTASKEWWTEFISEEDSISLDLGGKLVMLFDILQECEAIGDKVLVFSQSLLSLDLIEKFLAKMDELNIKPDLKKDQDCTNTWIKGIDYFRMDGSTQADLRKKCTRMFNEDDNCRARLFLISTRAGGLGINLVSANRVVIFDASWNPTHDVQSIFRVYRFGQKKPVYVYRFLAQGTMEEKIYDRQISKLSLSCRVVDEQQIERHFNAADLQELYIFSPDSTSNRATPLVPKDRLLAELLIRQKDWIAGYHEHDSLLENKEGEELTEEERKAAWAEYEAEKKGLISATGLGVISPSGALDINTIIEKIQEQWPGISQEDLNQKVDHVIVWLRHQQQQQQMQAYQQRQQLIQQQYYQQQQQQQQILQQQQQQYAYFNEQYRRHWPNSGSAPNQSMNSYMLDNSSMNNLYPPAAGAPVDSTVEGSNISENPEPATVKTIDLTK